MTPAWLGRRAGWLFAAAAGVLLVLTLGLALASGHRRVKPSARVFATTPAPIGSSVSISSPSLSRNSRSLQAPSPAIAVPEQPAVPVSVSVPSVGIDSRLQPLGILPDRSLEPPTSYGEAGWYDGGVRPGALGPAVIAGHVDSYQGPAIFFRLKQIQLGADVAVTDQLGITRHFRVTDIEQYPKNQFPTEAVYGPTPLAVVRLVTCTGDFDASKRSYVDNLVVSAILDAPRAG